MLAMVIGGERVNVCNSPIQNTDADDDEEYFICWCSVLFSLFFFSSFILCAVLFLLSCCTCTCKCLSESSYRTKKTYQTHRRTVGFRCVVAALKPLSPLQLLNAIGSYHCMPSAVWRQLLCRLQCQEWERKKRPTKLCLAVPRLVTMSVAVWRERANGCM